MGETGVQVTPLALARRFGSVTNLEVGFHCDEVTGTFLRAQLVTDAGIAVVRVHAATDALFAALAAFDLDEEPNAALAPVGQLGERLLLEDGDELVELTLAGG